MRFRRKLVLVLAAALLRVPATAGGAAEEFPFQFREGFIWVKVQTAGSAAPLDFLLDSGACVSVINSGTAERLGLKPGKRVSVQGVGARTEGFWPEQVSATASGVALPEEYLSVDLKELSGCCGCRVDGLIGADFFRGRVVQIDFAAGKVRVLPAVPAAGAEEAISLRVRHGALQVPVHVNGGPARWVRLDTGCASGLQWVGGRSEGHAQRIAVALTQVPVEEAWSRVQLGSMCFERVATDLHKQAIFAGEAGLLGNGLLSRFESVIVDAKAGRLVLQGRPHGKEVVRVD
jgi:Aspartyl protease